jgi:hypothetical protein
LFFKKIIFLYLSLVIGKISLLQFGAAKEQELVEHTLVRLSLILLAFTLYLRATNSRPKLPPGPRTLPLIGNLHLLAKNKSQPYKVITELSKQYGPVMRFTFGATDAVIISDYQVMKEAFVKNADITSERPEIILKWLEEKAGLGENSSFRK